MTAPGAAPAGLAPRFAGRLLERDLRRGLVAHGYAFYGEPGLGQEEAAAAWAAALLCGAGGCGACRDCSMAAERAHPDLLWVTPDGASLRLAQAAEACAFVARRPFQAGRRVVVIEGAERLTEEAGNRLLKELEEPPAGAVFVLLASRPEAVPATIRSRLRPVVFRPWPAEAVREALRAEGVEERAARWAAALSGGNPGRARAYARDPEWRAAAEGVLELLPRVAAAGPAEAAQWAARLRDWQARGFEVLEWMDLALRDALAARTGGRPRWCDEAAAAALAAALPPSAHETARRALWEARAALQANVNPLLTFEVLLIRLARAGRVGA